MARDQIAVMPPPEFVAPAAPATSVVAGLAIDWRWMAAAQRPITDQALNEPMSAAAWTTIRSWFV